MPDSEEQAARNSGVNEQSYEPVIPVRMARKRLDSNESLGWDQDVSQDHPASYTSTKRRSSLNFQENAEDVPFYEGQGQQLRTENPHDDSVEVLYNDPSIPGAHNQAPRSPQKSDASYGSRFSAYSETHWIGLPTERDPYLTTDEDDRRNARIRRLRDEFLTNERALPGSLHRSSPGGFTNLHESLIGMMENQTFFITKSGYIGIGPSSTRTGDQIWVFNGGNVPFIMRDLCQDQDVGPRLSLVGDAYVHGIMDGEAMDGSPVIQSVHIQ